MTRRHNHRRVFATPRKIVVAIFTAFFLAGILAVRGSPEDDGHDEFYYMSFSDLAQRGKGIVSFRILSETGCRTCGLDFGNQRVRMDVYFADIGEPLVEVLPGYVTNHPTNSFSQLDAQSVDILTSLRDMARRSSEQYAVEWLGNPLDDCVGSIGRILGVSFKVQGKATRPVWARTLRTVPGVEVVSMLEAFCRLDGWALSMGPEGVVQVNIRYDEAPNKWVMGRQSRTSGNLVTNEDVHIYWQERRSKTSDVARVKSAVNP